MMRGQSVWAVAVRKPNGDVAQVSRHVDSAMARHRWLRIPVVRGVVALGESLSIGFRALSVSAQYAAQVESEDDKQGGTLAADGSTTGDGVDAAEGPITTELSRGAIIFSFLIAIGFAILLFKVGPALITNWIGIDAGWFVIVEGLIRVTVFVIYLSAISLIPDLRRVFQYHSAEHKAINAYEAGLELTPANVQRQSRIHPRCGTAFLLWVMVIAIFVFAFFGKPVWYWLIVERILLLPVIAGIAYELIRYAGKHTDNRALMTALAPGLWLQRLTTRECTLEQCEVSIRALQEVLELEKQARPEAKNVEVMA